MTPAQTKLMTAFWRKPRERFETMTLSDLANRSGFHAGMVAHMIADLESKGLATWSRKSGIYSATKAGQDALRATWVEVAS